MQLEINDNRLKKIINDPNKLIKKVGLEMAKKMHQRFNELRASSNFKQYLDNGIGRPHPLTGNLYNLFGISLNKNYRLIVEPLSEMLDVYNIEIENIEDTKIITVDSLDRKQIKAETKSKISVKS